MNDEDLSLFLSGFPIVEDPLLAGCKVGEWDGKRLAVSPAFYSLVKSAKPGEELAKLVRSLRVVNKRSPMVTFPINP